jgi:MOSC domain-containing protein YiiM
VLSLHIAAAAGTAMNEVAEVLAVAGRGLAGDRYCTSSGTYSHYPGSGREVTLIEVEALDALARDYAVHLAPALTRRNIVCRGVALNHLVGRKFAVGAALLSGARLCEPCMHLENLTVKGTARGLIHRGGLRAEIIVGGVIRVGDAIVVVD